jgi:hypothetical protein
MFYIHAHVSVCKDATKHCPEGSHTCPSTSTGSSSGRGRRSLRNEAEAIIGPIRMARPTIDGDGTAALEVDEEEWIQNGILSSAPELNSILTVRNGDPEVVIGGKPEVEVVIPRSDAHASVEDGPDVDTNPTDCNCTICNCSHSENKNLKKSPDCNCTICNCTHSNVKNMKQRPDCDCTKCNCTHSDNKKLEQHPDCNCTICNCTHSANKKLGKSPDCDCTICNCNHPDIDKDIKPARKHVPLEDMFEKAADDFRALGSNIKNGVRQVIHKQPVKTLTLNVVLIVGICLFVFGIVIVSFMFFHYTYLRSRNNNYKPRPQ